MEEEQKRRTREEREERAREEREERTREEREERAREAREKRAREVQVEEQEGVLRGERERARERVAALEREFAALAEAASAAGTDDEHDPEGATLAFEPSTPPPCSRRRGRRRPRWTPRCGGWRPAGTGCATGAGGPSAPNGSRPARPR